jgi:hypothetical protein
MFVVLIIIHMLVCHMQLVQDQMELVVRVHKELLDQEGLLERMEFLEMMALQELMGSMEEMENIFPHHH